MEAIQDILKGKTTTMPKSHSGQGIFFTSKSGDLFILDSFGYQVIVDNKIPDVFVKTVKKENITQENIGEIMLCQIPGISTTYASAILKSFGGFSNMMQEIKNGNAKFDTITYECNGKMRKIPKSCGQMATQYLQNI
jgi:ERCC4-type nuclease